MKLLYLGAGALTAAVAALVTVLSTAGCGSAPQSAQSAAWISPDSMATVVTVNGQGVPVRELELFLAQDRAATFAYFQQKYNDNDGPGFWTTADGGQTPQDYLRKAAIADATRATAQLGARASRPATRSRHHARRQRGRRREGGVTESGYFTYVQIQLGIGITESLISHGVIHVTDAALEQYYRHHLSDYQQGGGISADQVGPSASTPQPFAQVKDEVAQDFEQASYNAIITHLADTASVAVNARVLAAIEID